MSLAAIIVSYRTGPVLHDSLAALGAATGVTEIIIVDNGNEAPEAAALDRFVSDPRVRLLRGQGNIGFAAACNKGASAATAEVLAFVNPDAVLGPDALEKLAAAIRAAPPPVIVGGDLRDASGNPERGSRRDTLTLWRALVSFTGLSRLERLMPAFRDFNRHRDPLPPTATPTGAISGALMAMRRADFIALGGFDEGYFLHVEDIDICRRAAAAGWRVLFVPGPHGVHARSSSGADSRTIAAHKARGMARYLRKFARGPVERALAVAAGAFLIAVSPK